MCKISIRFKKEVLEPSCSRPVFLKSFNVLPMLSSPSNERSVHVISLTKQVLFKKLHSEIIKASLQVYPVAIEPFKSIGTSSEYELFLYWAPEACHVWFRAHGYSAILLWLLTSKVNDVFISCIHQGIVLCLAYRIWLCCIHSSSTCQAMSSTRVIDKEMWTQLKKIYWVAMLWKMCTMLFINNKYVLRMICHSGWQMTFLSCCCEESGYSYEMQDHRIP